jgi:DNA-binding SARP family transcriptional activator
MEFKLLGPVEVVIGGNRIDTVAARQEIVLSLLLLEVNHVVSVDRLIDALWGEDPPSTARGQVQIIVSALRRILGDSVIVTHPPGYLLRAPGEAIDLARFEMLAASGASAAADRRFPEAVQYLRSALALWRGPALEGIASEVIRVAATRLNERRISVLLDCLDMELKLGRHRDLIGELGELVAAHPLNERLRAQSMLALYRAGRQADALEVFRSGREILQEELGLDPGKELTRLERAILTSDPELELPAGGHAAAPAEKAAGGLPAVPRQLPRAIADFTGREETLREISAVVSRRNTGQNPPEVPVVVLTGTGGSGKTALAIRAAHMVSAEFPDGQLFLQLHPYQREDASSVLEHVLRSVGIHPDAIPADLGGRSAVYRSWLAGRRVLIVINDGINTGQVVHLLPATAGCAAIVTSRQRFSALEGVHQIDVGPLEEEAAFALLTRLLGAERASAEEEAARELIRLCEGMPLALRIAAAKLAARPHWRIRHMIRQLLDEERRLDELELDGASIRATFAVSYDSLEEDTKRFFRLLSLFGTDDFDSWVGAPLLNSDIRHAENSLSELVRSHLVEASVIADGTVRYQLHDLVRIYAVERLAEEESASDRLAAVRRLLGCWLSIARIAHRRIYGGDFGVLHGSGERWPLPDEIIEALVDDPADWFRRERSSLIAAIYTAAKLNLDELCWDLAVTSATLFESGFHSSDWRESHAIALDVVRHAGNRRGEGALLHSLGTLEIGVHVATARNHFQQSLEIFAELGDSQGCALALGGLAVAEHVGGDYDAALTYYLKAVSEFREAGDMAGEAHALKAMAQIHAARMDFDVAERLFDEALAICQKVGSPRLTAQAQFGLGELYLRDGRLDLAVPAFQLVRQLTEAAGDAIGQAHALAGLGSALRGLGDLEGAGSALRPALELAEATTDRFLRARVLLGVAELDFGTGRDDVALARVDEAMRLLRELGSADVWQARALELLGRLHERAGQRGIAEHAWRSARELVGGADLALADQLAKDLGRL